MNKFKNIDELFSELHRETVTMRVYGKNYTFPAVIPADIPLEMAKYEDEKQVPTRFMLTAASRLFGSALDEWRKHPDFGVDSLGVIVKAFFEMVNGGNIEDEFRTEDEVNDNGPKG